MNVSHLLWTVLGGAAITLVLSYLLRRVLPQLTRKTKGDFDDLAISALADAVIPIGIIIILVLTEQDLGLASNLKVAYGVGLRTVVTIVMVRYANRVASRFLTIAARRSGGEELQQLLTSLLPLLRALVWIVGILALLQSLGVKMTVIWGLLSAGGIGIGLALKEPAQELFAYLMILLDKPFTLGQTIQSGSMTATVEKIGVRSTHLRSLRGELVVMNNSTLTENTIQNFAEMNQRRMIYSIGVTYDTTMEQMKAIPAMIEAIIAQQEHSTFSRCHFTEFGDSSLNFELAYYIDTRDYTVALNDQQAINLKIMQSFEDMGIEFAFPSQTVYLESDSGLNKES